MPPPEPERPREKARASRWAWPWWKPKTWKGWAWSILALVVVAGGTNAWIEGQQAQLPSPPWILAGEGLAREQAGELAGAAERYLAAAAQNDPTALGRLGWFDEKGLSGLPSNPQLAVQNDRRAARLGNAAAQERLMQLGQRW